MPEYLAPGVYVEEVPSGPVPIQGVSTSTGGFVGPTERGPTRPRMVTGWGDYVSWFGGLIDPADGFMPWSVKGFFDNGGQRLFVSRVVRRNSSANPAVNATFASLNHPTTDAVNNQTVLVRAIGEGAWGNRLFIRFAEGNFDPAAPPPRIPISVTLLYYDTAPPLPLVNPLDTDNIANPLRREPTVVEQYDNVGWHPEEPDFFIDYINARSKLVDLSWGVPGAAPAQPQPTALDPNTLDLLDAGAAAQGPGNPLVVANEGTWSIDTVADGQGNQVPNGFITFTPDAGFTDNPTPIDLNVASAAGPFQFRAAAGQVPVAAVPLTATTSGANPTQVPGLYPGGFVQMLTTEAVDGDGLSAADFRGNVAAPAGTREGLAGLADIDEVSILSAPDHVNTALLANVADRDNLRNQVVNQCEILKDRFAVVSVDAGEGDVGPLRPPRDTSYGAFYSPWIRVFDPRNSGTHLVPPVGHVAGIYARTDVERGVHKAPANEVVRGMVTSNINSTRRPLEFTFGKREQDILNPRNVNVIRDFRADRRGIRVFGARTMSSDATLRYVNVRRLLLYIEESIDEGTQWVVFEPNDEPLWARVRQSVRNFLLLTWRSGALQGLKEEEAFFVRCDRTTMTQADIDAGRLICQIGVAPVKPAEYVIFRIQQFTANE